MVRGQATPRQVDAKQDELAIDQLTADASISEATQHFAVFPYPYLIGGMCMTDRATEQRKKEIVKSVTPRVTHKLTWTGQHLLGCRVDGVDVDRRDYRLPSSRHSGPTVGVV